MIKLSIDVTKIPRERIKTNPKWKGKFLDCVLIEKPNDRGDDGFIKINLTKEQRDAGENGEIVGNWKQMGPKTQDGTASKRTMPATRPNAPMRPPVDPDLDNDGPLF